MPCSPDPDNGSPLTATILAVLVAATATQAIGIEAVVISTRARAVEGRPFLGHGPEFLLEHAPQTVSALTFPPEGGSGG